MKYTLHINYQFHEDYNSEDDAMTSILQYIHSHNCDEIIFSLERDGVDERAGRDE